MEDPAKGPKLKVKWAYEKIADIQRIIDTTFSRNPCRFFVKRDRTTGDQLYMVGFFGEIPEDLHRLVAETVYHLRSALDQTAVALAEANGSGPKGIYFPFAGNAQEFESKDTQRKIKGISPAAISILRNLKPYRGGNDFLWALGSIANVDKHVELIPIGTTGKVTGMSHIALRNTAPLTFDDIGGGIGTTGRLDEGILIANLGRNGTIAGLNEKANIQVTCAIAFGDIEIFKNQSIARTLLNLTQLVERIIRTLEPHC